MKPGTQATVNASQAVAPADTKDTTAGLPSEAFDDGNGRSSRPGPGSRPTAPAPVSSGAPAPATVGGGIGGPSAKDLNERKHDAIKTKLREAVALEAEKQERPKPKPLFGSIVETEEPDETPTPVDKPKPADEKPDELAAIAAKDAENRRLKKEMKRLAEAPRGVDMTKLRELAKSNPLGVAEALGMSLEDLNMRVIRGDKADKVALDEKPAAPVEDEEKAELRRQVQASQMRESRRAVSETVEKMVSDTKGKDGLKWANVAKVGAEAREAATANALAFARGEIDEKGTRLATPRRMKPIDDDAASGILAHFLDHEDARLGNIAAKLGGKSSNRPEPRKVNASQASGKGLAAMDPNDPNHPRNRGDWRDIGERVRAKTFGPR